MRGPATRDQVDAYRFGLRRLEAALVRGDPVPLHEQVRSQRRAVLAGGLIGALAMAAAAIFALVAPRPEWTQQEIVVGKESGAMYVVARRTDGNRLVPVANLVAARLVYAALGGSGEPPDPVTIPDDALAGANRSPAADVPGAPATRPDAPGITPRWAICDETDTSGAGRVSLTGTTVIAGAAPSITPVDAPAVLLDVPGGDLWLVIDGRRYRVDNGDPVLRAALGLAGVTPRRASPILVNALPEGARLERPQIAGLGGPGPAGLRDRVGDVLRVRTAGAEPRPYVVLGDGVQEISPVLAQVLTAGRSGDPRPVDATYLAQVRPVERAALRGWPTSTPRPVDASAAPVLCWVWSGEPGAPPAGTLVAGRGAVAPTTVQTISLAQADGDGVRLDAVVLAAGGGPIREVGTGAPAGVGTVKLVSETGVTYGLIGENTARVLGVKDPQPAPSAAVRWLPGGAGLEVPQAPRLIDVPGGG